MPSVSDGPSWPGYLLLGVIACAIVLLRVGDWQMRLAMVSGDDSMEAVAIYFARASEFAADAYIQAWSPIAMASAVSWIPALAYRYLHIHPLLFFKLFTVGQTVGLALAMFQFAFIVTRSQLSAWLTAALTLAWQPVNWNLALVGGLEWMPYANWVSLPFLVYAFSAAIRDLRPRSYASLLAGALIHPIMGAVATAIVVAYFAVDGLAARDWRRMLPPAAAAIAIAALSVLPLWLASRGVAFAPDDQTRVLLDNQHVRPWGAVYPYGISSFVSSGLCIASLVALANTRNRFFVVTLVMTCATTAAHFLAVVLAVPQIMSVIASRSTILLVLVALPFVAQAVWNAIRTREPVAIIAVVMVLFRTNAVTLLAATLAIRAGRVGAFIGAAVAIAALVPRGATLGAATPWLLGFQNLLSFSWPLALAGLAAAFLVPRSTAAAAVVVVAMLGSAALGASWRGERELGKPLYADYAAAQIWARDHTPPGSTFTLLQTVPEMSWRSLSERPVVAASGVFTAYRKAMVAADYNTRLNAFFARTGADGDSKLRTLDEGYWRAFAAEFGADYLVRPAEWPALAFTEAYRNASFRIYRISHTEPLASGETAPLTSARNAHARGVTGTAQ